MGVGEGLNGVKEKNNLFRLSCAYQCKRLSSKWSFHRLQSTRKGWWQKKTSSSFLIKAVFNKRICIHYLQTTHLLRSTALVQGTW